MTKKRYDLAVFIGRFQPLHKGHVRNINLGKEYAENVLVLIGSAHQPRTIKNPFTSTERQMMIQEEFDFYNQRVWVDHIKDYRYQENQWIKDVQHSANQTLRNLGINPDEAKVAIMGYEKDESSYYLKSFPQWDFIDIGSYSQDGSHPIDATKIRELMFEGHFSYTRTALTERVYNYIYERFICNAQVFGYLVDEYNHIKDYKKQWEVAPYSVTFMTVDAVTIQGGHILLVKRGAAPGKGLWALPGGFLGQNETCREAAIRELREETKLKVPVPVLNGSITREKLFDEPGRSLRGRTVTQAYLIELTGGDGKLPKVKGSDDACEARWFTIDEALSMSDKLFEDHHSIIYMMTAMGN